MKIDGINVHASVTIDRVMETIHSAGLGSPGFCIMCGTEVEGVEPDARKYKCERCEADCVYGAEEIAMHMS